MIMTAEAREPIVHTDTGDITMEDVVELLNKTMFGKPEDYEGVKREARIAAEEYGRHWLTAFSKEVHADRQEMVSELTFTLGGFWEGFIAAKTGKVDLQ